LPELIVKHSGPTLVVVIEVEGRTRVLSTAAGQPDEESLIRWVADSDERTAIAVAALMGRSPASGSPRQP
jgi:hypothetical protein